MSRRPVVEIADDGTFRLAHEWRYNIPGSMDYVLLPEGMRTNFATIPAVARWLISPIDPDIVIAALVHDWLVGEFLEGYMGKSACIFEQGSGVFVTRYKPSWSMSAKIMRWIMKAEGAPWWKRTAVYLAVRAHGIIQRKG